MPSLLPAEESRRFEGQDERHGKKQGEIRKLREEGLSEVVDESDDQTSNQGAFETSHPSDDDHHKGERQHVEINAGTDRREGASDHTGKGSQETPQPEDSHGHPVDIDAHPLGHGLVVHGGPQDGPGPRLLLKPPEDHVDDDRRPDHQ